ncbi:MAG: cytidylate kinase-like family protein [Armatimonadetes bacterium]|nr:cytidylate kinase-like family protein [Armatimonadota bacterium]
MVRIPDLAGRSLARWKVDREVAERFWRDEQARPMAWDVVTISRELGSGGTTVAKLVAQQLGFRLWDREILEAMAGRLKAELGHVEKWDEQVPSAVESIMRGALQRTPMTATYKRILKEILTEIAARGRAVILGRGGACLLPESLRVRVIAPLDLRIARVAELEKITEHQARKLVLETDARRRRFGHVHFRQDLDSPLLYDLVINTQRMSLEFAATLVIDAVMERKAALEKEAAR